LLAALITSASRGARDGTMELPFPALRPQRGRDAKCKGLPY